MPSLENLKGIVREFQEEASLHARLERILADALVKAKALAVAWSIARPEPLIHGIEEARKLIEEGGVEALEKASGIIDEACREAAARAFEALAGVGLEPDECRAAELAGALTWLAGLEEPYRRVAGLLLVGPAEKLSELAARVSRIGDSWGELREEAARITAGLKELAGWGIDASPAVSDAARSSENPLEAARRAADAVQGLASAIRAAMAGVEEAEKVLEFCWDEAPAEACGRLAEERRSITSFIEGLRGSRLGLEEAEEAARRLAGLGARLRKTLRTVKAVREAVIEAGLTSMAAEMLMRLMEEGRIDLARLSPAEAEAVLTLCRRGLARCTATLK